MHTDVPIKPTGDWEVIRRIKMSTQSEEADTEAIKEALSALPGVRKVIVDQGRHQIDVHYDTSQTSYREIMQAMEGAGASPVNSWWSRIKTGWYQYTDDNARDNAKTPPPACCNKPPK